MKQGSAFPYISYAVARRTRIGFSVMTHCICHERGTRFNAVPGSTPNSGAWRGPLLWVSFAVRVLSLCVFLKSKICWIFNAWVLGEN
jgi:hypothetical protein